MPHCNSFFSAQPYPSAPHLPLGRAELEAADLPAHPLQQPGQAAHLGSSLRLPSLLRMQSLHLRQELLHLEGAVQVSGKVPVFWLQTGGPRPLLTQSLHLGQELPRLVDQCWCQVRCPMLQRGFEWPEWPTAQPSQWAVGALLLIPAFARKLEPYLPDDCQS